MFGLHRVSDGSTSQDCSYFRQFSMSIVKHIQHCCPYSAVQSSPAPPGNTWRHLEILHPAGAIWDLQKKLGAATKFEHLASLSTRLKRFRLIEDHAQKTSYSNPRPSAADVAEMLSAAHHGRRPPSPVSRLTLMNNGMSGNPHAVLPIALRGASLKNVTAIVRSRSVCKR